MRYEAEFIAPIPCLPISRGDVVYNRIDRNENLGNEELGN
jgi:hypothetical protein